MSRSVAPTAYGPPADLIALRARAFAIRDLALRMGEVQGQGYVGQALGFADVLAALYFHALRYRPKQPDWDLRDRCLLSIGHYAIALYAALIEAGVLPLEALESYGGDDSPLPMSGMASYTVGMEISGGSLGQGLPIAVGSALALRHRRVDAFVFNLMSDGELNEGATWEAAQSASHWGLSKLICVVDVNNQQADGPSSQVLGFEPLSARWQSFGWYVQRVNGNDLSALVHAFDRARLWPERSPRVILCDTLMGKGVPLLEQREKNHFIRVEPHEWALARQQLHASAESAASAKSAGAA